MVGAPVGDGRGYPPTPTQVGTQAHDRDSRGIAVLGTLLRRFRDSRDIAELGTQLGHLRSSYARWCEREMRSDGTLSAALRAMGGTRSIGRATPAKQMAEAMRSGPRA